MGFLLHSALKDLKWRLKDPVALLLWAGIPLILGLLLALLDSGMSDVPQGSIHPLIHLEYEVEPDANLASGGIGRLFLPGILFMSLIFIAQGMSIDIWKERDQGTLRRVMSAPQNVGVFLGGKLAAAAVLMVGVSSIGLLVGTLSFDIPFQRLHLALLWCAFSGTALLTFFLLIQLFATSQRGGSLLTNVVMFPLIMLGGSIFPFEAMPDWMAGVGRWTPNGLAVSRLEAMLAGDNDLIPLLVAALGMGLPAVGALVLSMHRLRGRFIAG